jgi:hypothetical protein
MSADDPANDLHAGFPVSRAVPQHRYGWHNAGKHRNQNPVAFYAAHSAKHSVPRVLQCPELVAPEFRHPKRIYHDRPRFLLTGVCPVDGTTSIGLVGYPYFYGALSVQPFHQQPERHNGQQQAHQQNHRIFHGSSGGRARHCVVAPATRARVEWGVSCVLCMRSALPTRGKSNEACCRGMQLLCSSAFGRACKGVWPVKTAETLASLAGCSVRAAAYQISGEHNPSGECLLALMTAVVPGK